MIDLLKAIFKGKLSAKVKHTIHIIWSVLLGTGIIIAFSINLGALPKLGEFLFPGQTVWELSRYPTDNQHYAVENISESITIYKDEWGVPHIFADTEEDAMFAMGFLHAQDRLFMMDLMRRLTSGRLSEIMGPSMISTDKFNLNMLKYHWAEQTYQAYLAEAETDATVAKVLEQMEEYVRGVNYFIKVTPVLPLEYQLLGFQPEPWTLVDSLLLGKYMAEDLTWRMDDLYNLILNDALNPEDFAFFFEHPYPYQVPICPNYGAYTNVTPPNSALEPISELDRKNSIASPLSKSVKNLVEEIEAMPQINTRQKFQNNLGSNNWVITGDKSATGSTILCNDMHLGWTLPPIWYQTHIVMGLGSQLINLWGFTVPGFPYPLAGQNQYVGWGLTNCNFDVIDWYYYSEINSTHYIYNNNITEYGTIPYTINVNGNEEVDFEVRTTVHGPVFDEFSAEFLNQNNDNLSLASRWTAHNVTWELLAFYGFAHSKSRNQFNTASQYFANPAQNIIFGDKYGNIGIRPTGLVPIRDDTGIPAYHYGNGSMPYNGSAGQGEWIGYVPFEELPHTENPSQNYLASANQISAGPTYNQYNLQNSYAVGYRARRINDLLNQGDSMTVEHMQVAQLDSVSVKASALIPILLDALENLESLSSSFQTVQNLLAEWDYQMLSDSTAAVIFKAWEEIYKSMIFGDELQEANVSKYLWKISDSHMEYLTREMPSSRWFNNISTTINETRNDIMISALEHSLMLLEEYFQTSTITDWTWGDLHFNYFGHLTGLDALSKGPYPANGTSYTLNPAYGNLYVDGKINPIYNGGGASERMILDFNNFSNSISVIPGGQSGITYSSNFADQLNLFNQGKYHSNYFQVYFEEDFHEQWKQYSITFWRREV